MCTRSVDDEIASKDFAITVLILRFLKVYIRLCNRWHTIPTLHANVAKSMMDGKIMLLLHTLTTEGSHVASLIQFHPVV